MLRRLRLWIQIAHFKHFQDARQASLPFAAALEAASMSATRIAEAASLCATTQTHCDSVSDHAFALLAGAMAASVAATFDGRTKPDASRPNVS